MIKITYETEKEQVHFWINEETGDLHIRGQEELVIPEKTGKEILNRLQTMHFNWRESTKKSFTEDLIFRWKLKMKRINKRLNHEKV